MNKICDQVGPLKRVLSRRLWGAEFEGLIMENVSISESLFADDTLILLRQVTR